MEKSYSSQSYTNISYVLQVQNPLLCCANIPADGEILYYQSFHSHPEMYIYGISSQMYNFSRHAVKSWFLLSPQNVLDFRLTFQS